MREQIKLIYPEEVGFYGSVSYRFFPSGVECEIISQNESSFGKQTGRSDAPREYTEKYNIQAMARDALRKARLAKCEPTTD